MVAPPAVRIILANLSLSLAFNNTLFNVQCQMKQYKESVAASTNLRKAVVSGESSCQN